MLVEDQLFATLDPTLRRLDLPVIGQAVLADTVGFIRQLPHALVDAFRATLEEVNHADLILHVVDAAAPLREERMEQVNLVLEEIGASSIPQLVVYNKADLVDELPRIERDFNGMVLNVWLSSVTGDGKELLLDAISERLASDLIETSITLGPEDGRMRARFYEIGAVISEITCENGSTEIYLKIRKSSFDMIVGHRMVTG